MDVAVYSLCFIRLLDVHVGGRATGNSRFKTAKSPREVRIFPKIPVIEITALLHQFTAITFYSVNYVADLQRTYEQS